MNLGRRRGLKQSIVLLTVAALWLLGYARAAASVTLSSFKAQAQGTAVQLIWTTATEVNNVGFSVLRSNSAGGSYSQITASIIPSKCLGCVVGASYSFSDSSVSAGQTYYYKLESVDVRGAKHQYGPVSFGSSAPTATPVASATPLRTNTPGASSTLIRTNTPVSPSSTQTRAATLTATPRSAAAQPTPLTKVAIAVTGGTPSPVRSPSGTRVAVSAQPTIVPAPVMIAIKSSDEDDALETEPPEVVAQATKPHPLVSVAIFGVAGMFGCGSLVLAAFACLICAGIIRRGAA